MRHINRSEVPTSLYTYLTMVMMAYHSSFVLVYRFAQLGLCDPAHKALEVLRRAASKQEDWTREFFLENLESSVQQYYDNVNVERGVDTMRQVMSNPHGETKDATVHGSVVTAAERTRAIDFGGGPVSDMPSDRPTILVTTPGPFCGVAFPSITPGARSTTHKDIYLPTDSAEYLQKQLDYITYDFLDPKSLISKFEPITAGIPSWKVSHALHSVPAAPWSELETSFESEAQHLRSELRKYRYRCLYNAANKPVRRKLERPVLDFAVRQKKENPSANTPPLVMHSDSQPDHEISTEGSARSMCKQLRYAGKWRENGQASDNTRPRLVVDDLSVLRAEDARRSFLGGVISGFSSEELAEKHAAALRAMYTHDLDYDDLHYAFHDLHLVYRYLWNTGLGDTKATVNATDINVEKPICKYQRKLDLLHTHVRGLDAALEDWFEKSPALLRLLEGAAAGDGGGDGQK